MTRAAARRLARHLRRVGFRARVLRHRAPSGGWFFAVAVAAGYVAKHQGLTAGNARV